MLRKFNLFIWAILLFLPLSVSAREMHSGDNILLEADKVIDGNYYAAGNNLEIRGTINGDVFLAGNSIVLDSENINGDVFAAGSSIIIKGKVNGSLRLAAQKADILGQVARNVMFFGQDLRIDSAATVGQHLTFFGQNGNIFGQVGGRLEGAVETIRLDGSVAKDADIYLTNTKGNGLILGDSAKIGGALYYQALQAFDINSQASIGGGAHFNQIVKKDSRPSYSIILLKLLIRFFAMLVVGMIFLTIWPRYFANIYQKVKSSFWRTFVSGLLLLLVTPLACLLLAITVIGLPIAGIIMVLWLLMLYLAKVMGAWLLGNWLKERLFNNRSWNNLYILALGAVIFIALGKIPILGGLVAMIIYILAWGSLTNIFKKEA